MTRHGPYTLLFEQGINQHFFRIPRDALALPSRALSEMTARTLGQGNPVAGLASTYFTRLATCGELRASAHTGVLADPSIELIRAVIATQLADSDLSHAPLEATLNVRIMEYLRSHLAEHDLSAAQIAAAHHISVRHLYTILERNGVSLGDWVRTHRLEQCHKELARAGGHTSIAAIAYRWGFTDPAHFSRIFKRAYGMTPRAWRGANGINPAGIPSL